LWRSGRDPGLGRLRHRNNIFTTIYLIEAWDTDRSLAQADLDGVGDDIRQLLSLTDLFRPASTTPAVSSRRGGSRCWTCSGR
jgi:hypothetical protein